MLPYGPSPVCTEVTCRLLDSVFLAALNAENTHKRTRGRQQKPKPVLCRALILHCRQCWAIIEKCLVR